MHSEKTRSFKTGAGSSEMHLDNTLSYKTKAGNSEMHSDNTSVDKMLSFSCKVRRAGKKNLR